MIADAAVEERAFRERGAEFRSLIRRDSGINVAAAGNEQQLEFPRLGPVVKASDDRGRHAVPTHHMPFMALSRVFTSWSLTGAPVTQVREDIRTVDVVARSAGAERLDPAKIGSFTLTGSAGQHVPLDQIGHSETRMENPIMRRRDRQTEL